MRILWAFIKKEFLQIFRDPSSILIAFIDAAVFDLYVWHQCRLRQYQSGP